MDKKLFGIILVVVVGVIMAGSLLAPIVSDYADEEKIYYNEGTPYAAIDEDSHTLVISMDTDSELSITVDGESVDMPDFSLYSAATIIYGSDGLVRLGSNGLVQCFSGTNQGSLYATSDTSVTITFSATGVSMTDGTSTKSAAFTVLAYIGDGDYSLCLNPCVTDDSIIIAGVTRVTSSDKIVFLANGTLDDLTVSSGYVESADSLTVSSVSAVVNTTSNSTNLVQIDSVVFTAVMSDESEWTGTYTYFLAPYEVVYDNPTYLGSATSGLLAAVVVMFLVALIIIPTRLFNRDD